jgi:hypothetical protein
MLPHLWCITRHGILSGFCKSKYHVEPIKCLYTTQRCGHCKRVKAVWDLLASKHNSNQNSNYLIGKVDCTSQTELCSDHDILSYLLGFFAYFLFLSNSEFYFSSYPTFIFYNSNVKTGERYTEDRDIDSFVEFIQSKTQFNKVSFSLSLALDFDASKIWGSQEKLFESIRHDGVSVKKKMCQNPYL